ncbi:MAG: O-antigen ligase family protein [Anaerolineaceae bacterium]|nr:O-antigen ligase family protein [Betaproteobacteria bacterium]
MNTRLSNPFEFFLLVGLIIFVPLLEAPKNIFWAIFIGVWVTNHFRTKDWGGAWDLWDSLIAIWILSSYFISAFSGLHNSEWGGANDILRYASILWAIKRSGYNRIEFRWLLIAIAFSTLIALIYALWSLFITHTEHALELNSVGHVNHSAIYLAISFGALISLVLAFWEKCHIGLRTLGAGLSLLFAVSIFISDSRAAVGISLLAALILGLAWLRRSKFPLVVLLATTTLLVGSAYLGQVAVVQKQESLTQSGIILSNRNLIWNMALVAWHKYPIFGVGMHNYNQISFDKVKAWQEEAGNVYVASEYAGSSHAHSLYITSLAERGLIGTGILLGILLAWFLWLIRFLPKADDEDLAWALWGGSFSAFFVTVSIGLVNTTLHHEHAILSTMLLGMWLSFLKSRKSSAAA